MVWYSTPPPPPPPESLLFTTTYYTREGARALIFKPNCGGRVENNFWRPPPPYVRVWMAAPPAPPAPPSPALYLEVWIWHRVQFKF